MTGIAVGWGPVVPDRPAVQSDRQWMADYARRREADRVRPLNRVLAAEAESQNAAYGRALTEARMNAEQRRQVGRGAQRRAVPDNRADAALIERYNEIQRDMEPLLRSAQLRSVGIGRSIVNTEHTGPDCEVCRAGEVARAEYSRTFAVEDIQILRSEQGGDGRTVEAYAAVFGQPAEIRDWEGRYIEMIEPSAFNRTIENASRARGGFAGSVKVLFNHGNRNDGEPSELYQMPVGVPVEIRADTRGLLTRTRYSKTPLADEVLENIRNGSITAQSFVGKIMRSDPQLRRGDRRRPDPGGQLPTVRRMELGLREYGPVLWPAYTGAEIIGVRSGVLV